MNNPITIQPTKMPVGSILMWPTDNDLESEATDQEPKQQWMICDGRAVSGAAYTTLYHLIANTFGNGGNPSNSEFNIPDMRGRFVRGTNTAGVKGEAKHGDNPRDPDTTKRQAMQPGGSIGDNVGSIQDDQFREHDHRIEVAKHFDSGDDEWALDYNSDTDEDRPDDNEDEVFGRSWPTRSSGGAETRPINAYLNFLIRVK